MPKSRTIPTRMCVACRTARPKRDLVRVVRTPSGAVVVDPTGKLAGRGAYVCPSVDCARSGVREGRLAHALQAPLPEGLEADLLRVVESVLAARAGADRPKVIRIPAAGRRATT
ncbi:MAG: YlxR family protein [Armatimonadota bacterium]|nr:YlxR family protein [Armatimonadota bacterium]MDR7400767.1 YlxR family protein [Armatimonadota bacterium]MDR7405124.1 YlxR family protein [Armatimonadota bacterium]MDR7436639.1 YlxR family protein [Armatimonadota bacterium]MDR7472942.1 YlxR family protein [Armatimonadota bacterium]